MALDLLELVLEEMLVCLVCLERIKAVCSQFVWPVEVPLLLFKYEEDPAVVEEDFDLPEEGEDLETVRSFFGSMFKMLLV